jgi:hypothetical protein
MTDTRDDHSAQQARSQLASILDILAALECEYVWLRQRRSDRDASNRRRAAVRPAPRPTRTTPRS